MVDEIVQLWNVAAAFVVGGRLGLMKGVHVMWEGWLERV